MKKSLLTVQNAFDCASCQTSVDWYHSPSHTVNCPQQVPATPFPGQGTHIRQLHVEMSCGQLGITSVACKGVLQLLV